MFDWAERVNWGEYVNLLESGNPPLIVQFLILNTIFMIWWIVRRWQGKAALRRKTAIIMQSLLVGANLFILFRDRINFDAIMDSFRM